MYKLLLVDDEEEVRKGILHKIEWEKYGFEIAGEAENGREALEIAERTAPDVVITDIKMPFMDGLKLSEQLKEKFPTTKIIILTGFDEFEYAHKAIKLNVVEYVLKPVSSKDLIDILIKVKSNIDAEIAQKEDIHALREHYRKSLPVLKEKFLTSLINGKFGRGDVREKARNYEVHLDGKSFVVSLISIDYNLSSLSDASNTAEQDYSTFKLPEDKELLEFAVFNIAEEIVERHQLGVAFLHNDYIAVITVHPEEDREAVLDKTLSALEEVRQSIEKYLKYTITAGVGTVCQDIALIHHSFRNALSALDYRLVIGNNRIIFIEDVEPLSAERIVFDELKEHALSSCIKVGTQEEISQTVDGLFEEIISRKASFKDYQVYLLEMLTTIFKAAKSANVDIGNVFGANYNLFVELYKYNDLQDIKNWVKEICSRIMGCVTKSRQDTCSEIVSRAKDYVRDHYQDSDITINKVCSYLHISPTYFSSIFKKETRMTFINYLTQVRMDAAKELLRSTGMKSFEIAEKVGFSEPNYFSYCFKKNFGISPSEYRNAV